MPFNDSSVPAEREDATLADGGSYQIVTSKHLLKIQNIIRKAFLGKKEIKTLKTNATYWMETKS